MRIIILDLIALIGCGESHTDATLEKSAPDSTPAVSSTPPVGSRLTIVEMLKLVLLGPSEAEVTVARL